MKIGLKELLKKGQQTFRHLVTLLRDFSVFKYDEKELYLKENEPTELAREIQQQWHQYVILMEIYLTTQDNQYLKTIKKLAKQFDHHLAKENHGCFELFVTVGLFSSSEGIAFLE